MPNLILDSNIIVLFVVGQVDVHLLGVAKRVKEYRPSDFEIVLGYLNLFDRVILLPNTLTEASNLLRSIKDTRAVDCAVFLALLTKNRDEIYVPSGDASDDADFVSLGMTDAAILCALAALPDARKTYLLTADEALYLTARARGYEAEHYWNLRSPT